MIASTRTARLYSALSARERALMVLQAWKEGREEDPEVRRTAPDSQVPAFNDYIDLMNAVNERLGRYAAVLRTRVEQLGLICGWLATIRAWGLQAFDVGLGVFRLVPEPISESAYVWLKKGRRSEPRPDSAVKYAVYPDGDPENEWREKEYAELWTAIRGAPLGAFADECDTRIDKVYRILLEPCSGNLLSVGKTFAASRPSSTRPPNASGKTRLSRSCAKPSPGCARRWRA
jgi:hypothetical protein